jgi:hypothetical protein
MSPRVLNLLGLIPRMSEPGEGSLMAKIIRRTWTSAGPLGRKVKHERVAKALGVPVTALLG